MESPKNVTEEMLRAYINTYHATAQSISAQFFEQGQREELNAIAQLPARVICYISTQFGVALEYLPARETTFQSMHGSARVEDLLVRAPPHLRHTGPLIRIGGRNTGITGGTLANAFPFRLSSVDADVTLRDVAFTDERSGWRRDITYAEIYGDRRFERWTTDEAVNRAKDVVLRALITAQRAKTRGQRLHDYVNSFREKTVLLLGAYDPAGAKRLTQVSEALSKEGYEAILMQDVPDFEHYDLAQKVVAVGAMCRFVVIENSSASGHLAEFEICKANRWVTLLLHADGKRASYMSAAASATSNVIEEFDYESANPSGGVTKAVAWAEARLAKLAPAFEKAYPWRKH